MGLPTAIQGISRRVALMDRLVSTSPADVTLSPQGDIKTLNVLGGLRAAAVERAYYIGTSIGTRNTGTTITSATGTAYSTTNALLVVANTNSGANAPDVFMDSLSVKVDTIAGGSPTFWYWYHAIDRGNRAPLAGTGLATLINMQNCDGAAPNGVQVYGGLITAAAVTSDVRDIGFNILNNGASIAGAIYILKYGRVEGPASTTYTIPTTAVAQSTFDAPTICIPPGYCYVMSESWVGRTTTGLVGEMAVGLIVR